MLIVDPHRFPSKFVFWQMLMRNEQKLEISVVHQSSHKIWVWPFLAESVHFCAGQNFNGNFLKLQLYESILFSGMILSLVKSTLER